MTDTQRPKASAAKPEHVVELYGPEDDGWYSTKVMDWVALCEQLKDGEVRGYLVLRSLVIDKFKAHVRVVSLQLLCELIPSPSGGPSSLTRVRGIIAGLTGVGLLTTPEGGPIKTSSRPKSASQPLRIRVNDTPPKGYTGWRNTEHKLKALGAVLSGLRDGPARPVSPDAPSASRKSDPPEPPFQSSVHITPSRHFPARGSASPDIAGDVVRKAWESGFASTGRLPLPKRGAVIAAEAARLIAAGHCPDFLSRVAEWMGKCKPTWKSLEDALTWPDAPTLVPSQRPGSPACGRHPAFARDDCPPCRLAERDLSRSGPGMVQVINGATLLARARAVHDPAQPYRHDERQCRGGGVEDRPTTSRSRSGTHVHESRSSDVHPTASF